MKPLNNAVTISLLLFLVYLIIGPCIALSVGFTDMSLAGPMKLEVYSVVNGTHLYTTNTSSQFETDESVIIQIIPDRTDYIRNPRAFLDNTVSFVGDNVLELMILCFVVGFLITRR